MKKQNSPKTPVAPVVTIAPGEQTTIPRSDIARSFTNREIGSDEVTDILESIRQHGVIQPLVVRPASTVTDEKIRKAIGKARYVLVAGERRWFASGLAKLQELPVVIRQYNDREALEVQAIENLQRKDLKDIEEAQHYRRLLDAGSKAEEIALRISKSRAHIYNCLKLLELPEAAQKALSSGQLDRAIALLIARMPHPTVRQEATKQILAGHQRYDHREGKHVRLEYSFREAKSFLAEHFMLQLVEASWDLKAEGVVEGVQSCLNCPKRAGNMSDLFGAVTTKTDLCTDAACFNAKKEAHWAAIKVQAQEAGHNVLDEATSKKIFPHDNEYVDERLGYVRLDGRCSHDSKSRSWRQVLGKKATTRYIARLGGKPVELVKLDSARLILTSMGMKLDAPTNRTSNDYEKQAREASLIRRTTQERAVVALLAKLPKHKNCTEITLQLTLAWLALDANFETKKAILRTRGIETKDHYKEFDKLLLQVKPDERPAFIAELALWMAYFNTYQGNSKLLVTASSLLKLDLPEIEKTVKDERKTVARDKQKREKARAKLN